jgi:hypothetical protein
MGERWVTFYLGIDETLRCTSCSKYLHDQKVYLYLYINDGLNRVMCEACFKKEQEREKD